MLARYHARSLARSEVLRRPAAAGVLRRPAAATAAEVPLEVAGLVEVGTSRAGWARRQYCWWVTFAHPYEETAVRRNLRTPSDFTRESFLEALKDSCEAAGVHLVEVVIFLEPHERRDASGNAVPHLNALLRASQQFGWRRLADKLWELHRCRVDFAENIRSWYDGVVYGTVASAHKPQEKLDATGGLHWALSGHPVPLSEVLPARFNALRDRQPRLTPLQAYDLCRQHNLRTVPEAWAKAESLSDAGDRGLLAFLLDHRDVEGFMSKILQSTASRNMLRRQQLGRIGLLREAAQLDCCCTPTSQWETLARETLQSNGLNGPFQRAVFTALAHGRGKLRNVFLMGPTTCGKSFLIKPLSQIFKVYKIPDDGSHKLENVLDAELLYLNEFTWSEKWLSWAFMKSLFEGEDIMVARPKNRGGNVLYQGDAPVIGTCPSRIQMFARHGHHVCLNEYETQQMDARVRYLMFSQPLAPHAVVECPVCMRCAARLYLEGAPAAIAQSAAGTGGPRTRSRSVRR